MSSDSLNHWSLPINFQIASTTNPQNQITTYPRSQQRFVNSSLVTPPGNAESRRLTRSYAAKATHARTRRNQMFQHFQNQQPCQCRNSVPHVASLSHNLAGDGVCNVCGCRVIIRHDRDGEASPSPTDMGIMSIVSKYGAFDLLSGLGTRLTRLERFLLDHYVDTVIPTSAMQCPPISYDTSYVEKVKSQLVPYSMADPGMLSGLLLIACRSLAAMTGDEKYKERALIYKTQCISSIRSDIEMPHGEPGDDTVVKALYLASDEYTVGDIVGSEIHTKAIKNIVTSRGGLSTLGMSGLLETLVLWNDRATTLFVKAAPTFVSNQLIQGPANISLLAPGFLASARKSIFCTGMVALLGELTLAIDRIKAMPASDIVLVTDGTLQSTDFQGHILAFCCNHHCVTFGNANNKIEECLGLSLMILVGRTFRTDSEVLFSSTARGPACVIGRIKSLVADIITSPEIDNHAELFLWITFVSFVVSCRISPRRDAVSLRTQNQTDVISDWFVDTCSQLSVKLDILSADTLRETLQQFLWVECIYGDASLDLWRKIQYQRKDRMLRLKT